MPSMYEIYNHNAIEYDELVMFEDYNQNLSTFIKSIINGKKILELGAGTGRVTQMYIDHVDQVICCDRASHMLEHAKKNLARYNDKIFYECIDNRNINQLDIKVDGIIEGWALGHTAIDEYRHLEEFTSNLMSDLQGKLNKNGFMLFIETMGTNTENPKIPDIRLEEFYHLLEEKFGMKRYIIRTDYKFNTIDDARRILSFFFGDQLKQSIQSNIIKEFTGVWFWSRSEK